MKKPAKFYIGFFVAGAALAGGCLFLPGLHTLTHEFSTLFTGVAALALYWVAGRNAKAKRNESSSGLDAASQTLPALCLAAALASVSALAVLTLANEARFHCDIWTGLPFFLITWIPTALFAICAGTIIGALGVGWGIRLLVLMTALLLDGIHDGLQLYFGPRVYPTDFFLGDLASSVQRGSLSPSGSYLYQRIFLLAVTWVVWDLGRWVLLTRAEAQLETFQSSVTLMKKRTVAGIISIGVIATCFGSYVGLGMDRKAMHRETPLEEHSAHFVIRYADAPEVLAAIDSIRRNAEWEWEYLNSIWNTNPTGKTNLYVFKDRETLQKHTGIGWAHAGIGEVFIELGSALSEVILHELTHALHSTLKPSPLVLASRGMLEGTATAFERRYAVLPEAHELQAAALRKGKLPSAESIMSLFGFLQNYEGAAYETAGSFLGFLVYTYGMESFIEFQQSLDYEKAYGKKLDVLGAEWRAFLGTIPARAETELYATQLFDTRVAPSYFSMECPKVGATQLPLQTQAHRQHARGEYKTSTDSYRILYEQAPSWKTAAPVARVMEDGEDWEGALSFLASVSEEINLEDYEQAAVMARRVRLLIKAREWEKLYATYDERAAGDYGLSAGNRFGEACLRDPQLREQYASILEEGDESTLAGFWRSMLDARPDFPPLLCMYAYVGIPKTAPLERREAALINAASLSSEIADLLAPKMRSLYNEAMAAREFPIAESLCRLLLDRCANAQHRYEGNLGLERLAFERRAGA
jgi:hypothetical protein